MSVDFDDDMFDPEDLEMMGASSGEVYEPSPEDLQDQVGELARLIWEGGEREKQLRLGLNRLEAVVDSTDSESEVFEQMQSMAKMLQQSVEREKQLRASVSRLANLLGNREK